MPPPASRTRGILERIGLTLAGLALALGVAEVVARSRAPFVLVDGRFVIIHQRNPENEPVSLREVDGVPLWFRTLPDRQPPKPIKDGIRIVVIGDSVLMPALLPDRAGAARVLEGLLRDALDGGPYEVVNLAQGGWSTIQEEVLLRHEGLALHPDLVVVGLTPNDAQQFALVDQQLVLADFVRDAQQRGGGFLMRHSYLRNWLWLAYEAHTFENRSDPQRDPVLGPFIRMEALTRAAGARFAILCFPNLPEGGIDPRDPPCGWTQVVAWARDAGVPLLALAPIYLPYPMVYMRLDGIHLTTFGHRVLAAAWLRWLVDERLIPWRAVRGLPDMPPVPPPP